MAILDFPSSPTLNQVYQGYSWDGEKWIRIAAGPATVLPIIDGTAAIGVSAKYALEDHVHPSDANARAVRYDAAQGLTAAQQAQARQNIYAAPLDALAYSGIQLNGSLDISQEKGSTATTTTGVYICDGWRMSGAGTMAFSTTAAASAVFASNGFSNALSCAITTAQGSLAAADSMQMYNRIEGLRTSRLAWGTSGAQPITIGFWTAHHRTGLYSVVVRNLGAALVYVTSYTQNAADVPQYNVITIPGPTSGTWYSDNNVGMDIGFINACGTTNTAPLTNSWIAGPYLAVPGQVNAAAATSDVFRLTGFVVLPGIDAPSAARSSLIMRPYDQELQACKRYWQLIRPDIRAYSTITNSIFGFTYNAADMRASPTITMVAIGTSANASAFTVSQYSSRNGELRVTITSNAVGDCYVNDRTFSLDARQ